MINNLLIKYKDIPDLKNRLANIIIGYTYDNQPVTASQLKAQGAMAALLKDALKPRRKCFPTIRFMK